MSEKELNGSDVSMSAGPPPTSGDVIFERTFPSSTALVQPQVVRALEFLEQESLIQADDRNKIGLCLREALQNAVSHGNKDAFGTMVELRIVRCDEEWRAEVVDQGEGFSLDSLPAPDSEEALWGERGRGIAIMSIYADRLAYYGGGAVLVMAFDR